MECGALGGNCHTLSPQAPLASSPLLSHCSGSAEPTSKTSISRTRVRRGMRTACCGGTQPGLPHPLGTCRPSPLLKTCPRVVATPPRLQARPAPRAAAAAPPHLPLPKPGALRTPALLCAPPRLSGVRRARASSGRVLQWWQGSSPFPAPPQPAPRAFSRCVPLGPLCLLPAMVPWRSAFLICLAFSLATLIQRGKAGGGRAGTHPGGLVGRGLRPRRPRGAHERPGARLTGLRRRQLAVGGAGVRAGSPRGPTLPRSTWLERRDRDPFWCRAGKSGIVPP